MTDFTEASDRCTSDISSSSFRSECNNHNRNDEIRSLKSKFRRQKAKSRNQCKVYAAPIAYIEYLHVHLKYFVVLYICIVI